MKCEAAQDWLLQCESLQPKSWPRGVVKHLRVCTSCYQFAKGIKRLEKAWRKMPLPEECETAKAAFLAKLAEGVHRERPRPKRDRRPKTIPAAGRRPAWGMRGLAAAAVLFVGVLGVGWLLPGRTTKPDVVENKIAVIEVIDVLVDWNVRLANADPKDRKQVLEEFEGNYRTDLKRAVLGLPPEDRQLAEDLVSNGRQLAAAADPLAEAEAVTAINEKLFSQAAGAVNKGNESESQRCGMRYSRFNTYAFRPVWDRLSKLKSQDTKDKGGNDKGPAGNDKGDAKKQLDAIYQRSPEFSNPNLHRQFDTWGKKGPHPGFGPGFGPPGFGPPGFKGKR